MSINEINKKLSNLIIEREIVSDKEKALLKDAVSLWADGIPHHGIDNFGERIKIVTAKVIPSYDISLKVEYEIRSLHEGTWSYQGKDIFPSRIKLNNKSDIWLVNLPLPEKFGSEVRNYSVTEKIFVCDACSGQKNIYCPHCGGHGAYECPACGGTQKINCSRCNGNGRIKCDRCWGHGSIKGDSSINYREIPCPSCGGQRFVFCSSCAGSGARQCTNCTNGRVVCSRCLGSGVLTCSNCKGTGQLIFCIYLKDEFAFKEWMKILHNDSVPAEICLEVEAQKNKGHTVIEVLESEINKDIFKMTNYVAMKQTVENLLEKAKDVKDFGVYLDTYRILKEKVEIKEITVTGIEYEFSGKTYKAWVSGDNKVWAPISPISEICENLFNNAKEEFKKKEYSIALDSVDKVIEMFGKEEHKNFKEKIKKVINRQYTRGAVIGGTVCPIIGNILGIMIGFILQNIYSVQIRTSRNRFFFAFLVSFAVNAFLLLVLSIIILFI